MAYQGRGSGGGLAGLMKGLKLSEEEEVEVKGAWRTGKKELGKAPQAVGKLFSQKPGYAEGIVRAVGKVWCPEKGIRCKELGDNLFLFSFLQPGGKKRAITEGPWEFGGDLLIVVDFDSSKKLHELEFNFIPIWIHVLDLPIGLMNVETGEAIGDRVGETIEVESDQDGSSVGRFLRIKVRLDIRKPLMRGVTMEGEKEGEKIWCRFQYEFLPNFCYTCGLLGHVDKECDEGDWRVKEKQFGDWLRAPAPSRRAQSESRSKWSDGGSSGGNRPLKNDEGGRIADKESDREKVSARKEVFLVDSDSRDVNENPLKSKSQGPWNSMPYKLSSSEEQQKQEGSEKKDSSNLEGHGSTDIESANVHELVQGVRGREEEHINMQMVTVEENEGKEMEVDAHDSAKSVLFEENSLYSTMDVLDEREERRVEGKVMDPNVEKKGMYRKIPRITKGIVEALQVQMGSKRRWDEHDREDGETKKFKVSPGEETCTKDVMKAGLDSRSRREK